ncbi:MAG: PAS domain S-box protein [Candidatus Aminicenantes bacterium]|nr:PAS domain S-box protein [Candidatus Aminicenantes bacterium]
MFQTRLAERAPGKKVWSFTFVFLAIILLVGGYFLLRQETRATIQEQSRDLLVVAELKVQGIKQWRQERLNDAANIAASPLFSGALSRWLGRPDDQELKGDIVSRLALAGRTYGYENIFVVDTAGQILLFVTAGTEVVSPETGRALEQALDRKETILSELQRNQSSHVFLDSVSPVISRDGSVLGALILRSDANLFLYPFLQSWPTPSPSAETMLVRRQGEQVFYLNELRHRSQTAFSHGPSLSQVSLPAVRAVLGQTGVFEGDDYRGIRVLADIRPVPESSWFLLTKIDAAEILAEARSRSARTMVILGLLMIISGGLAFFGYRQKKIAYLRTLYRLEKMKRETQEEFRTILYSIGDAVITTDREGMIRVMNPMAEKLTGWKENEAVGKPLNEVFHIISEETRARAQDPVSHVLQMGTVVGLANHTLLISRDGQEIPIADAGAPIRDEHGQINGVVLVFRDQTRERAARQALEESEKRYRVVVENAHSGVLIVDQDYRFEYVNERLCEILGRRQDEIVGHDFREFLDEESRALVADRYLRRQRGEDVPSRYEFNIIRKDGEKRRIEISSAIVKDLQGRIITVAQLLDITERKKAEEALRASEKKYRFLFNAGNDAIFVYRLTEDRRPAQFVEANELACRLSGYTKEELMELTPFDLVVPEERAAVNQSNLEISQKKQRIFERTFLTKDGRPIPCEFSSHFFEMNGQPTILAIARNITERKKAEESLRAALREKDVMLKEIHHRVKNNLQVMASLLRLQAAQLTEKKAREAFRKSQTRIRSMAMIHERLYQSGNLASVDFADYVEKLVTHLYVLYEVDQSRVHFRNEVGEIGLDINQAIPCGLIVNELVSNALKYAFPGSKKGELLVKMFRDENGRIHLVVKDTGRALPARIDIHSSETLGFQIINDLTKQLNGTLEYRRDGGNEFEITF